MARLEGAYEQVSLRLVNIDPRFDTLDRKIDALDAKAQQRFDTFDQRFNALDKRIDAVDAKSDQRFMWMVGIFGTSWMTTIAAIYFHH